MGDLLLIECLVGVLVIPEQVLRHSLSLHALDDASPAACSAGFARGECLRAQIPVSMAPPLSTGLAIPAEGGCKALYDYSVYGQAANASSCESL